MDPRGLFDYNELWQLIIAIEDTMNNYKVGSPQWMDLDAQRQRLFAELLQELQKPTLCVKLARGGAIAGAGGVGAFTGYYISEEVNNGFYTIGLKVYDWYYGTKQYQWGINF